MITAFIKRVKEIKTKYKINDNNIYNIDESGVQIDDTEREKIFCSSERNENNAIIKSPALEKWITSLKAVIATDNKIAPLLIFAAKSLWTT